jgi:hypothetical protein
MAIKSIEWLGMYEAKRLIVKSKWMQDEVFRIYKVPLEKIDVAQPKSQSWLKNILGIYHKVAGGKTA